MVTHGLLVRLEARAGKNEEVEAFLRSALPMVQAEPATTAWYAVRFGRGEYGIVDFFPNETGRQGHLNGAVARALMAQADALFEQPPRIDQVAVLADKLPAAASTGSVTKAILLTFKAKQGHDADVEQFLRDARPLVMDEPETIAWFALRLSQGEYGIFDVFPDNGGRFAHLTGHVPRELAKHALTLLGSVPHLELLDTIADATR
jgi:quinol monooxygenase YgiN